MKFWIKYIFAGLILALSYILLLSDSQASITIRAWLADRLVHSVKTQPVPERDTKLTPVSSYASAIAKTAPSVVSIQTVSKGTLSKNPNPSGFEDRYLVNVDVNVGSGVVIDSRGYVVTNYHVIYEAESIKVQMSDGRQKIASVIGSDPITDLALLHIDLENLPTPEVNNERIVRTGDIVFAIGNPYGRFDQTVTMGIVSATRSTTTDFPVFQIDAAIHPGNSGGALINAYGEIIGITAQQLASSSQGAAQTGIGFSIPFHVVQEIVEDLMDDGKVNRGWLGFTASSLNQKGHEIYAPEGVKFGEGFAITGVDPNGPAALVGLKVGDFVTHINGQAILSFQQVFKLISTSRPNDKMLFSVYREKQPMEVTITVGEAPSINQ